MQSLEEENGRLRDQWMAQSRELEELKGSSRQAEDPAKTASSTAPQMTLERMKRELEEPLRRAIATVKQKLETSGGGKGERFGMRLEYEEKNAVYGLIRQEDDPDSPFLGKVLVPYEKFFESGTQSKSYGRSTTEFVFLYTRGKWILKSFKQ